MSQAYASRVAKRVRKPERLRAVIDDDEPAGTMVTWSLHRTKGLFI